ncbi:hypothetical protein TRFO_42710 [Tritrichomonas foetus]|uniref:Myb-like domain-containing protein n=1 Tax=Tritrichomonas foetus TaxID=1144522 RepID=A0A1J4KUU4_9EUKA|nr:hypothetical protein TRFO_42710 [Tritrichomonas foetus]|eukprot:OHT15065.1 hypothetical protein TRFO_42710 [Tritrichomonas foetus]
MNSSSNNEDIYLTYDEIEPFLCTDMPEGDISVQENLKNIRKKTAEFRISRVNALYDHLKSIWPAGNAVEYYIGFELYSSLSEEAFLEQIRIPDTIKCIEQEVALRKKGISRSVSASNQSHNQQDEIDSDGEVDFDVNHQKRQKRKSTWSPREITKLVKLLSSPNDMKTWRSVSKVFKNKTPEQCFHCYLKLLSKGEVNSTYAPKKDLKLKKNESKKQIKSNKELDTTPFQHVQGLFLIRGDQKSVVGPQNETMKDYARNNPLFGYIDLITYEKMFVPAISSHGTVLDYDTWMKVINDSQIDPYELQPVNTKRQITILTPENIEEFRPRIRNMDQMLQNQSKP